jgi:hypothetical protein
MLVPIFHDVAWRRKVTMQRAVCGVVDRSRARAVLARD